MCVHGPGSCRRACIGDGVGGSWARGPGLGAGQSVHGGRTMHDGGVRWVMHGGLAGAGMVAGSAEPVRTRRCLILTVVGAWRGQAAVAGWWLAAAGVCFGAVRFRIPRIGAAAAAAVSENAPSR